MIGNSETRNDSGSNSDRGASYFRLTAEQQVERNEVRNHQQGYINDYDCVR